MKARQTSKGHSPGLIVACAQCQGVSGVSQLHLLERPDGGANLAEFLFRGFLFGFHLLEGMAQVGEFADGLTKEALDAEDVGWFVGDGIRAWGWSSGLHYHGDQVADRKFA